MELNKTIQNFKEQQKKMHAFDHVMNLLTYDAATGMPPAHQIPSAIRWL